MLGHASLEQTSTYLNATLRGLHRSMRAFDQARGLTESTAAEAPRATLPEFLANSLQAHPPATHWHLAAPRRLLTPSCW
jgi:hypothetical protein